jgi:type I restriction enzyme S subunit
MVRDGQAMRYSNFAQVRLFTLPLDEQEEIADYLDNKCLAIDRLIEQKQHFLTELESYKKSLIYECVTGKRIIRQGEIIINE